METKNPEPAKPSLYRKTISGANWGMLAGFWVELPMMAAFLFKPLKPTSLAGWAKVSEWSVKWVLPATLAGVVYGFTKPDRDAAQVQKMNHDAAGNNVQPAKSWVAREAERNDPDSHLSL